MTVRPGKKLPPFEAACVEFANSISTRADEHTTPREVEERFCALARTVMSGHFHDNEPADCFCGANEFSDHTGYRFSKKILTFIEEAVAEKLAGSK